MTVQQSANREETMKQFLNFCHRMVNEDADLAHKLIGEQFVGQIDLLLSIIQQSVSSDGIEHWLTPEGFRSLLALIGEFTYIWIYLVVMLSKIVTASLKLITGKISSKSEMLVRLTWNDPYTVLFFAGTNGQGVATSAISTWVKNSTELPLSEQEKAELDKFIDQLYDDLEKESGTFLDNEGSALYALQSACNHSCDPNAKAHFLNNDFKLSMIAQRDIACGEEILVSYLDDCTLIRSKHTRQKILMSNYLFKCDCRKCFLEADGSDVTSDEEMSDDDSDS